MKKSFFLIVAFLLIMVGCSKDPADYGNVSLKGTAVSSANNDLSRPMRIWLFSTPDLTNPVSKDVAGGNEGIIQSEGGWMSGHSNCIKHIDPANSHFILTGSNYDYSKTHIISTYAGEIASDKEDAFYYTCIIVIDLNDMTFSGTMALDGGKGFFSNDARTLNLTGSIDTKSGDYAWTGTEVEFAPPK